MSVQAQVDPSQNENDFRTELQSTLTSFINADWKIQSVQRSKDGKYENVLVTATARVAESENHHLSERADAVSRIGFQLRNPQVDYALSFDDIQAINAELRLTLLNMALKECSAMNDTFKDAGYRLVKYRVASTRYDQGQNFQLSNNTMRAKTLIAAHGASPAMMGSGVMPGDIYTDDDAGSAAPADLNVSTLFSMTGQFVLRALI